MEKGKIIVFEGACDGIGKSTQLKLMKERLENEGKIILTHHFPTYNTYHGRPVEEYLKGNFGEIKDLSPYFVAGLYAMDRAIINQIKFKKALEDGKYILLDRYTGSSLIYQSALIENIKEKNKFIDYVRDLEYDKLGIVKPDLTIFLYADFDVAMKLKSQRTVNDGIKEDLHERDIEFMKKVYDSALYNAERENWDKILCSNNDIFRGREEIHEEAYQLVKKV